MGLAEKNLLVDFTKWLLTQGGNDAATDNTGTVLRTANQGKNPWFIPGSWGQTGRDTRPLLGVPQNMRLFIVVASSHATKPELPPGTPADTPAKLDQALKKHAEHVHRLWKNTPMLLWGGVDEALDDLKEAKLERETTDAFDVTINQNNMYERVSRGTSGGEGVFGQQRIVTVAHFFHTPPVTKPLQFVLLGQSLEDPKTGSKGEKEYNVHVRYAMPTG